MNKYLNNTNIFFLMLLFYIIAISSCTLEDDIKTLWAKKINEKLLAEATSQINVMQINTDKSTQINQSGEYSFGTAIIGEYKDITFTIRNSGDANLVFETVNDNCINLENNTGNIFTVISQPSSTMTVAPKNSTNFSIRFNPITPGTNFNAIVKIKTNSRVNEEFSFIIKGSSVLAVPSGITAVFQQPNSIILTWNPVQKATSYNVYYGTSNSSITILAGSAVNENSYTHTGLSDGTTYFYCITAVNDTSESSRSQSVSMLTRPGIPANFRSTASTYNSITIGWNKETSAKSYNLYFSTSVDGNKILIDSMNFNYNSYIHTNLTSNTTYYYFITAVNNTGEGAYGEALLVRTLLAPLSKPSNITATALSINSIQVSWDTVTDATNYKIYRATSATGTKTLLDTNSSTTFTNTGLSAQTYWYYITAINVDNVESGYSDPIYMSPKPTIPSNVSAGGKKGYVTVTVTWSDTSWNHNIYYATSPTDTKTLLGTSTNRYFDHSGTANTTYYYWVTAVNIAGESDFSLQVSAITPPTAPLNLRQTASTKTSITIAWDAVVGATNYYIERGNFNKTQTGTSITISDLSPGYNYTVYVSATNEGGVYGPRASISAKTSD